MITIPDCPICGAPAEVFVTADRSAYDGHSLCFGISCSDEKCKCAIVAGKTLKESAKLFAEYAREQTEICRFVIDIPPITKKNHQEIHKRSTDGIRFIDQSQAYKRYERAAAFYVPWPEKLGYSGPIDEPINVKAVYYMGSKRKVDKTNLESALADVLVNAGLLADDNRDVIASTDGSIVLYDKDHPRTEVTITRRRGYERWKE